MNRLEERKKKYLQELDELEYRQFSSDENMEYQSETKSENAFNFGGNQDDSGDDFSEEEVQVNLSKEEDK